MIRAGWRGETNHNCNNRYKYCHVHIQHALVSKPSPHRQEWEIVQGAEPCVCSIHLSEMAFARPLRFSSSSKPAGTWRTLGRRDAAANNNLLNGFEFSQIP